MTLKTLDRSLSTFVCHVISPCKYSMEDCTNVFIGSGWNRAGRSGFKWLKSAKNNFTKCNFFIWKSSADSHDIHFRSFHSLFIQNLSNYFGNLYDQLISQLFLYPNCWRIFEIWSYCAPQRQLKLLKRKRETLIVSTATAFAFLPSSTIFLASHNLFKAFLDLHFSALPLPQYLHK